MGALLQLLPAFDVLSILSCVEILYCEYYGCISKIFLDRQT